MKLALIGGGGVRAPEFVRGAAAFAGDMDLQELWLMDIEPQRLAVIEPLCQQMAEETDATFAIKATTDLDEALQGAGVIVTTIRVGGDHGRVLDERIALRHNVLGQETTGAGGFSMAMRSIPALIHIAERSEALAPDAWTFNFTNPAGLATQALYEAGFQRVIGICDSANTAQHEIARWQNVQSETVKTEVFGLNHLSWTRSARINGRDVLPQLLQNDRFIQATHLRFFGGDLIQRIGMFLNEYLFYYYFRDVALTRIQEEELTRGEEIEYLNQQLFENLQQDPPNQRRDIYETYVQRRNDGYMAYAEADANLREARSHPAQATVPDHPAQESVGGYAGVALRTALALLRSQPLRIGLNVANNGAIHGLRDDDVVEITCQVDGGTILPISIGDIPESAYLLIRAVKHYERLAVEAILQRDRELAVEAMAAHPLVGSYALGHTLVNDYLESHRAFVGEWD